MSSTQRNDAPSVAVPSPLVATLREQTLLVLEVNHQHFEDVSTMSVPAQLALAAIYRDAFAVLDAVSWTPAPPRAATITVPLSTGHLTQLHTRHADLLHTNLDRLTTRTRTAAIDAAIAADRISADHLTHLFTITTPTT
ncbi:MAG TPA: hypothetical protein VGM33_00465 [Baekduia sp.]|jgi:hypothetical protein